MKDFDLLAGSVVDDGWVGRRPANGNFKRGGNGPAVQNRRFVLHGSKGNVKGKRECKALIQISHLAALLGEALPIWERAPKAQLRLIIMTEPCRKFRGVQGPCGNA